MAAPTLALTFSDLRIRVAEMLGVNGNNAGTGVAELPTNQHDLDLVGRLVNDGYRKFLSAHPNGWSFLNPIISITFDPTGVGTQCVDGDAARYYFPAGGYGNIETPFVYPANGPRRRIDQVRESHLRQIVAGGETTGDPTIFATRPLADALADADKTRWEVVFWPTPATEYTVTSRARLWPNKLVDADDVSIAGFQHDQTILAFVLAEAELTRDDKQGVYAKNAAAMLVQSINLDRATAPRRLGYMAENSDGGHTYRPYTGVDTYNGNPV